MRVLLIGGTGVLSSAVAKCALENNVDVYILNRGTRKSEIITKEKIIIANIRNIQQVRAALHGLTFDVIVDFLSYNVAQISSTLGICKDICKQYVFISSATVYSIIPNEVISEETPIDNNAWSYAYNKKLCEEYLKRECKNLCLDYTIVRPYITYGETRIPFAVCTRKQQWSVLSRILHNKPILLWDDGTATCCLTHTSDFARAIVGLFLNDKAFGQAFHITTDEVLTWNDVVHTIASSVNRTAHIVYIPSDKIENHFPQYGKELTGDKARSYRFNNWKIQQTVPGFKCEIKFRDGISETIKCFIRNSNSLKVDYEWDARMDNIIENYCKLDRMTLDKLIYYTEYSKDNFTDRLIYIVCKNRVTYKIYSTAKAFLRKIHHSFKKVGRRYA